MASTRFSSDPARINKQLEIFTHEGRYHLDTPGPGQYIPFMEDPNIRLQRWGANMRTHTIEIEDDLRGQTRLINHGRLDTRGYKPFATISESVSFPTESSFVEESRATHPAWMYRDRQQTNWSFPQLNPQFALGEFTQGTFGLQRNFQSNIQTRLLERDYYTPTQPESFNSADILPVNPSINRGIL
jgi:hypothetical protein